SRIHEHRAFHYHPPAGADAPARACSRAPMNRPPARFDKLAFVASPTPEAERARAALVRRYGDADPQTADVIVALGGGGLMLPTLHKLMTAGKPIYGMHPGTIGFLMNAFHQHPLPQP